MVYYIAEHVVNIMKGVGRYREFVQILSPLTDNPNTLDSFGQCPLYRPLVLEEHQVELLEEKEIRRFLESSKTSKNAIVDIEGGRIFRWGGDFWAGKINNSGPDFQVGVDRNPRRFGGICL